MSSERADRMEPRGHAAVLEGLWRSASDGRLPHGLLLSGPEGVGKFLAARWLAFGLLCAHGPGRPCGACGPCKRTRSGNHPDLFVVDALEAGQDRISVAFVTPRERRTASDYDGPSVGSFLDLQAMEGGWRVVVVREAERMTEQAQNAFLKTLEEPGRDTCIALETARPDALLETVRSRLVRVDLARLSAEDTAAVLREHGLESGDVAVLARWCRGAPGRGLTLAARSAPRMRELLLAVVAGERPPVAAAAELWELPGEFPGKTPAARRRLRAATLLDVGLELWLDQERAAAGAPLEALAHGDVLAEVAAEDPVAREQRREVWLSAREDVAWNASPDALVDRALAAAARPRPERTQETTA